MGGYCMNVPIPYMMDYECVGSICIIYYSSIWNMRERKDILNE
jgi:hypothetical protein